MKKYLLTLLLFASLQSCAVIIPAAGFYYLSQETETSTHNEAWGSKISVDAAEYKAKKDKELVKLRNEWDLKYNETIFLLGYK